MKKLFLSIIVLASLLFFIPSCKDSNDGGSSAHTGDAVFWTNYDLGTKKISVIFKSERAYITKSSSTSPYCGKQGSATFENIPVGTYNYTATLLASTPKTWRGEVTIKDGRCIRTKLSVNKSGETTACSEDDDFEPFEELEEECEE